MRTKSRNYKNLQVQYEAIVETDRKRKKEEDKKAKFIRCMMRDMEIERIRRRLSAAEAEEGYLTL